MLHIRALLFFARWTCCLCRAFILRLQPPLSRLVSSISFDSCDNFLSAVPSDSAGEMF
jgi:hypothetical protein